MKPWPRASFLPAMALTLVLVSSTLALLGQSTATTQQAQQPETAWVIWETKAPMQRITWDGAALWAGAYKGGLFKWNLDTGPQSSYSVAQGLPGDDVFALAVDQSGRTWIAGDSCVARMAEDAVFTDLTPAKAAGEHPWDLATHGDDIWLATRGGGVSKRSGDTWTTYTTLNSELPHDDVYAVALGGEPTIQSGEVKGFYLWLDPETYHWNLVWSSDGEPHTFSGEILADGPINLIGSPEVEIEDAVQVAGDRLTIDADETIDQDRVTFSLDRAVTEVTLRLQIDGAYYPFNMHLGEAAALPGTAPFRIQAPQPQPPVVVVDEAQVVSEGELVYFTGEYTDTDSPVGHTLSWELGDGTVVHDALSTNHAYADNDTFITTLAITDVHDMVGSDTMTVTIENVAPEVEFFADPYALLAGETITFTGSFYDPGTDDTHAIVWDFGDGSDPITTNDLIITYSYAAAGTYTATLTITDDDGGAGQIELGVWVEAPELTPTPTLTPTDTPSPTATETPINTPTATPFPW